MKNIVAYLGPGGTHSHLVAIDIFGPVDQFGFTYRKENILPDVIEAVASGRAEWGVVPYYTMTGPVNSIYPSMFDIETSYFKEFTIKACILVQISQDLLSAGDLSSIQVVYSKKEALDQCEKTIKKILPEAKTIACESTSLAAQIAEKVGSSAAAISSQRILDFHPGLKLILSDVQDTKRNITRFLIIQNKSSTIKSLNIDEINNFDRHTWMLFSSSSIGSILPTILGTVRKWGIGANILSGPIVNPDIFEMKFLLELFQGPNTNKVIYFKSEVSHLPINQIGAPIIASIEDKFRFQTAFLHSFSSCQNDSLQDLTALSGSLPNIVLTKLSHSKNFHLYKHQVITTMGDVWGTLGISPNRMLNTQLYQSKTDGKLFFCCMPGGYQIDKKKLAKLTQVKCHRLTRDELTSLGQIPGAISPYTAPEDATLIVDEKVPRTGYLFMGSGNQEISIALDQENGDWPAPKIHADITREK